MPKSIKLIIRLLIGCLFIVTAISKIFSLDDFELYIFGFQLFSFSLSAIVARLIICFEFLLGVSLLLKIFYKQLWIIILSTLCGFTLFLIYVAAFRNDNNCHCFGDIIELNPVESIIKNIITIILLFFIKNEKDYSFEYKRLIIIFLAIISAAITFFILPTDNIYNSLFNKEYTINKEEFDKVINNSILYDYLRITSIEDSDTIVFTIDSITFDNKSDRYIIGFVSAKCKFCKIGLRKAIAMMERENIDKGNLKLIIWGHDKSISNFIKDTHSESYDFWKISPKEAINITNGVFPLFVFVEQGQPIKVRESRGIEELLK